MAEVKQKYTIDISGLQAKLRTARSEMTGMKHHAEKEGESIGKALFGGIHGSLKKLTNGEEFGSELIGKLGLGAGLFGIAETGKQAVEMVHQFVEEYSHFADIAQRLESTPEAIQRISLHAKLAGTDLEGMVGAVQKLLVKMEDVGDPKVAAALQELNLDPVELAGASLEKQIEMVSHAFNEAAAEGRGTAATVELLGKGAWNVIAALREWDEVSERIKDHPFVSNEDVAILKEFGDRWELLSHQIKVMAANESMHPGSAAGGGPLGVWARSVFGWLTGGVPGFAMNAVMATNEAIKKAQTESGVGAGLHNAVEHAGLEGWNRSNARREAMEQRLQESRQKANEKTSKEIVDGQKRVADAMAEAREAEMEDDAKLLAEKQRIWDLNAKMEALAGPGLEKERLDIEKEIYERLAKVLELEKKISEEKRRQTEEYARIHDRERDKEEKDMLPGDRVKAIKADLKKIFEDEGVNSLGALKSQAEFLEGSTNKEGQESAKRAWEDYSRAYDKAKELADLDAPIFRKGSIAQDIDTLNNRNGTDILIDVNHRQLDKLDKISSGIAQLIQKQPVVIRNPAEFD